MTLPGRDFYIIVRILDCPHAITQPIVGNKPLVIGKRMFELDAATRFERMNKQSGNGADQSWSTGLILVLKFDLRDRADN